MRRTWQQFRPFPTHAKPCPLINQPRAAKRLQEEKWNDGNSLAVSRRRQSLIGVELCSLHKLRRLALRKCLIAFLGNTGEKVSCIGLGGFHLGMSHLEEPDAIKLFHSAIDRGINFSDNSWDYNQGESERRVGKALKGYREKVFVMTKFDGRTKHSALQQLDESLQRLQLDHVDLWQFHENIRLEDLDRFFADGGAREAMAVTTDSCSRLFAQLPYVSCEG